MAAGGLCGSVVRGGRGDRLACALDQQAAGTLRAAHAERQLRHERDSGRDEYPLRHPQHARAGSAFAAANDEDR